MSRLSAIALVLAALTLLAPLPAGAQQTGRGPLTLGALRACGGDIYRLCNDVPRGGGRIAQCLGEHRSQLSPACREVLAEAQAVRGTFFACAADAQRHCPGVRPGGGRVVACLAEKRPLLSRDCAQALDEASDLLTPRR